MIGGFEDPTRGTVYLGGRDVTDDPPYKRDVNTVFQSYALFPHLDVYENVAFGLRRKKVAKDEVDSRVKDAMRLVDLIGFETRKPPQMSGGQQQRVALARALVNSPKVLLLDEPLGALDLKLRKQMQLELKRIQQEVGITFIYVTHDQEEAMTMSDRLAVMRHGKIEQLGAPQYVYENPATEFVAGFLGRVEPAGGRGQGGERRQEHRAAHHRRRRAPSRDRGSPPTPAPVSRSVFVPRRSRSAERQRSPIGDEQRRGHGRDDDLHRGQPPVQGGDPGRHRAHGLRPEPRRRGGAAPGEAVTLSWHPEHTFAVTPQDDLRWRRKTNDERPEIPQGSSPAALASRRSRRGACRAAT